MTDWDAIKTQFEILGKSKEAIGEEFDISLRMLDSAINTGGWVAPEPLADGSQSESEIDALQRQIAVAHSRHQATLLPTYIEIETAFLAKLKSIASTFEEADEAKKIAETLALIKPDIMKQSEKNDPASAGGNSIMIMNQFPTPEPGEKGYIAPNAILIGENAGASNGVVGTDYSVIEIPEVEEMN